MWGKFRLFLPIVLAVLLTSAQNVFAVTEIAYDDGIAFGYWTGAGSYHGVLFSSGGAVRVVGIKFYGAPGAAAPGSFNVYITKPDHLTVLAGPVSVNAPGGASWVTVPFNVLVTGDFFGIVQLQGGYLGRDSSPAAGHSYSGSTMAGMSPVGLNNMIRALVEGSGGVGGVVLPTNTLTVLVPYFVVIGLVATAAVAIKKRRN